MSQGKAFDTQQCAEYAQEVYEMMLQQDESIHIIAWANQQSRGMRTILIDWLVDVHLHFKLLPETLYLSVSIIDRFLCKTAEQGLAVRKDELQLLGITSMFIACKYEEIYPPVAMDFILISDNAYKKE